MKTKTIKRVLLLSSLAAAVSACSTMTPPKKFDTSTPVVATPNLAIEKPFSVYDRETISNADAPSMAALRWQEFYADDKLKTLIGMALDHNKDLQKALLAIQNAKAQYQITDVGNLPRVGSSAGYTRQGDTENSTGRYNVNLGLSNYEIDFWGKVASQREQALHSFLATNAARDAAQISLISSVAQSYLNLSYALAQRHLASETLKTREQSLMITQKRFEAGIDSRSPSLQAEASLEAAKLALYQADTGILQARNALRYLVGTDIPASLMPEMAVNNITKHTLFSTGLPSELLYYRPDIVQAEHGLKAAGANINIARAAFFPSISLASSVGFSSSSLSNLIQSSAFGWSVGPSISLPIFDAGSRRANYEMAEIAQKSALVDYERAIQGAFKEVSDVLASRASIGNQLESQYKLQQNYQQTYNIAHARFRSGLDNYLGVLDAERSLFGIQQNILQAELAKMISQVQLYQALGGGASLSAEQIAALETQKKAMTTATIATPAQLANTSSDTPTVKEAATQIAQPAPKQ